MKGIKRIAVLVAVILVVLCLSALVSCGGNTNDTTTPTTDSTATTPPTDNTGNDSTNSTSGGNNDNTDVDNPNMVTVKVVDQNGKGIKGANIQICQGETCFFKPIITGADGVGSREYELNGERLKAKVNSIEGKDDYLTPGTMGYVYFQSGERELTIVIKKVTIEVFDQNEKSIEAAKIKLYQGSEVFLDELITDADGIATGFIASNGEEISAVVTEILSGGNYKLSNEATPFGIGVYDATITVNKLSAYTVKISTMLGKNVKNAKVELYEADTNRKKKTEYTDENGIVKFENIAPGQYYVKVSHENPSYVIISESNDGKFMFGNSTSIVLDAVEMPEIQYEVSLSNKEIGKTVILLNKNNEIVYEAETDENGTAYLVAPNGNYVAVVVTYDNTYYSPVYFEYDKAAVGTSTVGATKAGASKDTPILIYSNTIYYDFIADEAVWVKVLNASKKVFCFDTQFSYILDFHVGDNSEACKLDMGELSFELDTVLGATEYIRIVPTKSGLGILSSIAPGPLSHPYD